jgi:hypothetical protein
MSYVAFGIIASQGDLEQIIRQYAGEQAGYFLRWSNRVSGIVKSLPDGFEQAEGQVFNALMELRWKPRGGQGYDVLLLSQAETIVDERLTPIPGEWESQVQKVLMHDRRNPQYPQPFLYEVESKHIRQCYFRDANTGIVHFVALVLLPSGAEVVAA